MKVNVVNGELSQTEVNEYINHINEENPTKNITELTLTVDGEFVDANYKLEDIPFERIRRITGYLVGTVDRFNNGKRAEEHDRVKHSIMTDVI